MSLVAAAPSVAFMNRRKWILQLVILATVVLIFFTGISRRSAVFNVHAAEQRVYDEAGLFYSGEMQALEDQIAQLREMTKMDFVIVTTDRTGGKSSTAYADDFYDEGGFGNGSDDSGALFLIDMDNREVYISTFGAMTRYLTDSRIESILDDAYEYLPDGDYSDAAQAVIQDVAQYYKKGIQGDQYTYDYDTGKISRHRSIRWYEFLLALGAALACGLGAVASVRSEYSMKAQRENASGFNMAYRADAEFVVRTKNDAMVNSFVTQQIIPRDRSMGRGGHGGGGGRSTVHTSSSGRSHGGGGRRF
jgi:uncharacterized protein